MPSITVDTAPLGAFAAALDRLYERWRRAPEPLLEALAGQMSAALRANIETGGTRLADAGVVWPEHHPVTRQIRSHYEHGGPPLVRRGDLLRSIEARATGDGTVVAGSPLPYAAVVDEGGTVNDPRTGRARAVQAFPFARPAEADLDAWTELAIGYYVEGSNG